jgi:putative intracellular protease/amidase
MTARPRVLMPLPDRDFDTTEVAIPWRVFRAAGIDVVFATERGAAGETDPRLLTGVVFGKLGASPDAIAAYRELQSDPAYAQPITYADIDPAGYDGVVLPGGHAPGMRQYLESAELRRAVAALWERGVVIGAICHGTVVLARTVDAHTGRSIVDGRTMTALTKPLERAFLYVTFWKLGRRYARTYPAYVEDEVTAALGPGGRFRRGGRRQEPFVVEDGNLVTARWPGDAEMFAATVTAKLLARATADSPTTDV